MRELFRSILIEAGLLFCGANSLAPQETEGGTNPGTVNESNSTPGIEPGTMKRDTIGNTGATGGS